MAIVVFLSEFPPIPNEQERNEYKREFDRNHQEYKDLQAELDAVNKKLSDVNRELDALREGSPQYLVSIVHRSLYFTPKSRLSDNSAIFFFQNG